MYLSALSILSYRNLQQVELRLSPNVNCFIGRNGMGKTNVLDAVYFLSFCKSSTGALDQQCILHGADYFMLQGTYERDAGDRDVITCTAKRGGRKHIKRGEKDYKRLSEHIGHIPLVMISPADAALITGGSEERRRLLNQVIAQYDPSYLAAVMRYQKSLAQRNALLRSDAAPDAALMEVVEGLMSDDAERITTARSAFLSEFLPIFQRLYARLCDNDNEHVDICYTTHATRGALSTLLRDYRERERIVGYTLHGPHRDDLTLLIDGYPIRREGSQGQSKTFCIAMKLAQYLYLKSRGDKVTPLLLLDDIFDKLDAGRVARIVDYVSGDDFSQIFITDTNRDHLDSILSATHRDYRLFTVADGRVSTN
ncbi:MAG: DNA replication and repair protein RecF [Bacteroidales bacterium]|nr:DNA replication and repair protein RecF [Candidatus Equimonas enterica]